MLKKIPFSLLPSSYLLLFTLLFLGGGTACRKTEKGDNARLEVSRFLVSFDTVFTTVGSVTERFTLRNPHNFEITADIQLAGGSYSAFSINVDGQSGTSFQKVTLAPKDSLFIFVKVTINPDDTHLPFLVEDSILIRNGTAEEKVNLLAYGQNARFIVADRELNGGGLRYKIVAGAHETVTWTNDLPYVIYGWAVVDSLGRLVVEPGTQVYVHSGGGVWVYRYGNIEVNGTLEEPVIFQGDRRDPYVADNGNQWNRIWINECDRDNLINYAVVKGSYIGIQVAALEEYLPGKTTVKNTVIQDNAGWGILGRIANLEVDNCEISKSRQYAVECAIGNYTLRQVTVANNAPSTRKTPSLFLSNGYMENNVQMIGTTTFSARNCIFTGANANEIGSQVYDMASFSHSFDHCLIRSETHTLENFESCLFNQEVKFKDFQGGDFRLMENSPAIDAGIPAGISTDILGNPRDASPDLGAYEYIPGEGKKIKK